MRFVNMILLRKESICFLLVTILLLACGNEVEMMDIPGDNVKQEICFHLNTSSDLVLTRTVSLTGMNWKAYCFDDQYKFQFSAEGIITAGMESIQMTVEHGKVFRFLFLIGKPEVKFPTLKIGDSYWNLSSYAPTLPLDDPYALLVSKGTQDGTLRIAASLGSVDITLIPRATRIVIEKKDSSLDELKVNAVRFLHAARTIPYACIEPKDYVRFAQQFPVTRGEYRVEIGTDGLFYMLPDRCLNDEAMEAILEVSQSDGVDYEIPVKLPRGMGLNIVGGQTYYIAVTNDENGIPTATWTTHLRKKTFRIATQNLWGKGITDVINLFYKMDVDVMCTQESRNFTDAEVQSYGLYSYSHSNNNQGRTCIISKYPFTGYTPNGYGAYIDLGDGFTVLVMNCHGRFYPYGPYQLNGIPYQGYPATDDVEMVIEQNRESRQEMVDLILEDFKSATTSFVTLSGDFNEPSWLDWTEETTTAGLSPYVVQWPTTYLLWQGGINGDAYRTIHPNPVNYPGFTWTPRPASKDTKDRIDFTLYNVTESTTVKSCKVVGESGDTSDVLILPWIFDHRGLRTEFIYEQ